ncbi:hypothetical protein PF005_g29633 [Phytophthora fragariae]|uniref:Uncharacterized protein n=1 Tax=Phytophthora fragariae TaxID=53985 RepID=A0A6A4AT83_9STRA|nr:hypothetical protein PF003_g36750 [Phytophthora fragariae]KAE8917087.1 hypothetical protein PF009_g32592 [Phytophthora fragariae]KAE9056341.1 hypothetical protein PF007_g32029 [Phytophthora fragariae]KAE9160722.1 hypothetical protein PF002_g32553 [Phytophthora fragariae]KAE9165377.1 hypothetical protein PF005_g29633 [Phytophthora fragariae]
MAICNRTPGNELQQLIGEWVQPGEDISAEQILQYQKKMEDYELEALSWFRKDEWILELPTELPPQMLTMTTEGEQFWPTYK